MVTFHESMVVKEISITDWRWPAVDCVLGAWGRNLVWEDAESWPDPAEEKDLTIKRWYIFIRTFWKQLRLSFALSLNLPCCRFVAETVVEITYLPLYIILKTFCIKLFQLTLHLNSFVSLLWNCDEWKKNTYLLL